MACAECLILRRQIVALKGKIEQLRITLRDMGWDDPVEDERLAFDEGIPLVTHDPEEKV